MKRISEDEFINDIFNIINEDKTEKPKNLIQEENVNVGGKNALDFQLVAFITEKTIRGNFSEIHVISNDTGFNYAIDYINNCYEGNVNLEIIQNINKNTSKEKKNNKTIKINKESEEKKAFEEVASEKEENSENKNLNYHKKIMIKIL